VIGGTRPYQCSPGARRATCDQLERSHVATSANRCRTAGGEVSPRRPTTAGVAQPATEKDNAGTTLRRYANGPAGPYGYSAGTAGWQYLHHDALGSVSDVTNATGAAQWRYAYEPFGGLRSETKVVSTAPVNTLKYDSQYQDTNTGLYHLRARQYDPRLGRFTAQDPVSPSRNDPYVSAYAYANNQPTVLADPTGLTPSFGDIGTFGVSVADKLSMGTLPWARAQLGAGDYIDICSPAYTNRWTDGVALAVEIGTMRPWGLLRAAKMADEVATTVSVAAGGANAAARVDVAGARFAAEAGGGAERLPWTSWQNYPKTTVDGPEYAQIGDRLYTQHAVDRLQPSGLGTPAGASGPGRSISPNFVEDVLSSSRGVPAKGPNGEPRLSFVSGSVQVITENGIVVTVITR
jgi:RHS repeat-associated protein